MPPIDQTVLEHDILPHVFKPGRYLGMEHGAYRKDPESVTVKTAMIFPDLYEIGVSNYGHKLLYSHLNNQPDVMCDRAYAPAKDMMALLKERDIPLYGIESLLPLKELDVLLFTLQYELNYTSILGVLESAQIPFRSKDRPDWSAPLLIGGGPGSGNPMPLAPFFDAITIGDGEEILLELVDLLKQAKAEQWDKPTTRQRLAQIEGMYVAGISTGARKRIVDMTQTDIEIAPLIPYIQTVHDRVVIEARRGCDRMCRFCQPCFINLPVREPNIEDIRDQALKEIAKTGYEECSLLSLSIADYSQLKPLIHEVADTLHEERVSLSLPSQRADRFDLEVAEAVQQVRKSTLTFAPEAGSERLRRVLNKNLTDKEIYDAVTASYQAGWNKVKLYFMIGLPTETEVDLLSIVHMVKHMRALCREMKRDTNLSIKSNLDVNVTFSNFVPKPHTPFQWSPQATMAELRDKIAFLKDAFKHERGVKLNFTDPEISKLEAVISKGDHRLSDVIEGAYNKGAYLDAWEEHMTFPEWFAALKDANLDPEELTTQTYVKLTDTLPWDCIDMGLEDQWLKDEYEKSVQEANSDPCFIGCNTCGVCTEFGVQPIFIKPSDVLHLEETKAQDTPKQRSSKEELFPMGTTRVRLKLQKKGQLRFISHLDWLRLLQRAISRAGLPIAYSQGFNPKPKISFGPALPLFVEGYEEYVDLDMASHVPDLIDKLNPELPEESRISGVQWLPLHGLSLDESVRYLTYSSQWTCSFAQKEYTLYERVNDLLEKPEWMITVQKKRTQESLNLKSHIHALTVQSPNEISFTAYCTPRGPQVKPNWLHDLIDPDGTWTTRRIKVGLNNLDKTHQLVTV